jgi:hypothetical protein
MELRKPDKFGAPNGETLAYITADVVNPRRWNGYLGTISPILMASCVFELGEGSKRVYKVSRSRDRITVVAVTDVKIKVPRIALCLKRDRRKPSSEAVSATESENSCL